MLMGTNGTGVCDGGDVIFRGRQRARVERRYTYTNVSSYLGMEIDSVVIFREDKSAF